MILELYLVQGDSGEYRDLELTGVTNLDAVVSIRSIVSRRQDAGVVLPTVIQDSATRVVRVTFGAWLALLDLGTEGEAEFDMEIEATEAAGIRTFPTEGTIKLHVRRDLD